MRFSESGMTMSKWLACLAMAAGITMILSALQLLWNNQIEDIQAGQAAQAVLAQMQTQLEEKTQHEEAEEPIMVVDENGYLGVLSIPVLSLELPVMDQWSYDKLKIAPCRYFGSYVTQDFVIAGHSYNKHFGKLGTLQLGELIFFTDVQQRIHVYQVSLVEILAPQQVEDMVAGIYDLTLFTCTSDSQNRVAVRCEEQIPSVNLLPGD